MLSNYKFITPYLMMAAALIASSCTSGGMSVERAKGVTVSPAPDTSPLKNVVRIAVIDFYEHKAEQIAGEPNICPISRLHFIPGSSPVGSGEMVADQLRLSLIDSGFDVVHSKDMLDALEGVPESQIKEYSATYGAEIGRRLKADIVMMGSVMRFEELVGTKLAAQKPAAVGISLAVINVADGKILWKAKFEKAQSALLNNVLDYETFFAGGMVWQRASQLTEVGIANILERLPIHPAKK